MPQRQHHKRSIGMGVICFGLFSISLLDVKRAFFDERYHHLPIGTFIAFNCGALSLHFPRLFTIYLVAIYFI
ncbi:hypothetical protein V8F20_009280 [Naviculisporaceae sp. PSN 640]